MRKTGANSVKRLSAAPPAARPTGPPRATSSRALAQVQRRRAERHRWNYLRSSARRRVGRVSCGTSQDARMGEPNSRTALAGAQKCLTFVCPGSATFGMAAKAKDIRSLGLALAEGTAILLAFLYCAETTRMSAFFGLGCHGLFPSILRRSLSVR
jgi:hypothetical protein